MVKWRTESWIKKAKKNPTKVNDNENESIRFITIFILTIQMQKQLLLSFWNTAWIKNRDICKGAERKLPDLISCEPFG